MNGPFARAAARKLVALPSIQTRTDPSDRLDRIYLTVYGRKPSAEEKKLALAFVASIGGLAALACARLQKRLIFQL